MILSQAKRASSTSDGRSRFATSKYAGLAITLVFVLLNQKIVTTYSTGTTNHDQYGSTYINKNVEIARMAGYAPDDNDGDFGGLQFFLKASASSSLAPRIFFTPDGKVGIGTDRPATDVVLHTAGNIKVGTDWKPSKATFTSTIYAEADLKVNNNITVGKIGGPQMLLNEGIIDVVQSSDQEPAIQAENNKVGGMVLHLVDTGLIENHFGLFVGSKDGNNAVLATKGKHVGIGRKPRTQDGITLDISGNVHISKGASSSSGNVQSSGSISSSNTNVENGNLEILDGKLSIGPPLDVGSGADESFPSKFELNGNGVVSGNMYVKGDVFTKDNKNLTKTAIEITKWKTYAISINASLSNMTKELADLKVYVQALKHQVDVLNSITSTAYNLSPFMQPFLGIDDKTPWTATRCYLCGNDLESNNSHPCPSVAAFAGYPLKNAPSDVNSQACYACSFSTTYKGVDISGNTFCCPPGWRAYGDGSGCRPYINPKVGSLQIGEYFDQNSEDRGTIYKNVAQYSKYHQSGMTQGYIHLRLNNEMCVKGTGKSCMFHLRITGYAFASGTNIDLIVSGYSTTPSNGGPLQRIAIDDLTGNTFDEQVYHGTDNALYVRFAPKDKKLYYLSFVVDSMNVGGNTVVKRKGDVTLLFSANLNL